jgi:hypothetical protein
MLTHEEWVSGRYESVLARGRPTNPARDTSRPKRRKSQHLGRLLLHPRPWWFRAIDRDHVLPAAFVARNANKKRMDGYHGTTHGNDRSRAG